MDVHNVKRSRNWPQWKGFAGREELPRWFGLSVVLIYLAGLGAVAYMGITETRERSAFQAQQTSRYAVQVLAEKLSDISRHQPIDDLESKALGRTLREFACRVPVSTLRVTDADGVIVASLREEEIGTPVQEQSGSAKAGMPGHAPDPPTDQAFGESIAVRVPIPLPRRSVNEGSKSSKATTTTAAAPAVKGVSPLFVKAEFPAWGWGDRGLADYAGTLTVVLIVLGALLAIYRRLREQLRGVSRIVDRLESHRGDIERDLAALRITDAEDHLTSSWNQLIDSALDWSQSVQRQSAHDELVQVLRQGGGGSLAEALHAVPDGIIMISQDQRFEYFNASAGRLFGWKPDDERPRLLGDAEAEGMGASVLELLRAARRSDGAFEPRSDLLTAPDGEDPSAESSYRVQVFPLHRSRLEGACIAIIRDVSQQLRADRAREEFVTQVTHELRTPLTNIRAYAETLSSGMFNDPKVVNDCYNVITKETRRLSRLIEDILSVSQLEVGSIELSHDSIELKTLLADGVRDVRGLADEKEIDLQLDLPVKMEPITGDRDKLAVVINNLLGNAIKYTPSGGSIIVGCRFTGDEVVISFKDTGVGIDPADQERVFEKFQRGSDPEIQQEQGTGIGLYTAREIIRCHGGDIDVVSERGAGSTFLVRLRHRPTRAGSKTTLQES